MDVEAGDPACTRLHYFEQSLFGEVVRSDDALVGDKENWFGRVEVCGLWRTAATRTFGEWEL